MYAAFVRSRVRAVYERLDAGDWSAPLTRAADDVHHVLYGAHPLGGERHSRAEFAQWLDRAATVLGELDFEVKEIAVQGWPWRTRVAVAWEDSGTLRDGSRYSNQGVTWLNIRWGRVVEIREYLDTSRLIEVFAALSSTGVTDFAAERSGG